MSLREDNLRIAIYSTLAKELDAGLKRERAAHLEKLRKARDESGMKSFDVLLPNDPKSVGTVVLTTAQDSWDVDEAVLLEWAKEAMPTAVKETVVPPQPEMRYYELWPRSVQALLERVEWVVDENGDGHAVDTATGEVVPGLTFRPGGEPKNFQVRISAEGKQRLLGAWARGELNEITATGLLQLTSGGEGGES